MCPMGGHFFMWGQFMGVKKPTTFNEQVENIKLKGFTVDDEDFCKNFFMRVNYYRFSAYLLPFRKPDKTFLTGVKFAQAYKMYEFDNKMRNLIFSIVEEIELFLRTQLAYFNSHKYGPLGYKDKNNFGVKHNHERFQKLLNNVIDTNNSTLVVKHHKATYGGEFPLWVVIEFFSTGMLSYFYSDMLLADKKIIAKQLFNATPKQLDSWVRCVTDLRNRCAHYSRLYYWNFPAVPAIPHGFNYVASRKLFDQILVLKFLYNDIVRWNKRFVNDLKALIDEYSEWVDLVHIGFPIEWEKILK